MPSKKLLVILIIGLLLLGLFLIFRGGQKIKEKRVEVQPPNPKINYFGRFNNAPASPQAIDWSSLTPTRLPTSLPAYRLTGNLVSPFTPEEAGKIAQSLGLDKLSRTLKAYEGGGSIYIYNDSSGRSLSVQTSPPDLNYSEASPQGRGKNLPTLSGAEVRAKDFLAKVMGVLPPGWSVAVLSSRYLSGDLSSSQEVKSAAEANKVAVSLGPNFKGYKVLDSRGEGEPIKFYFDSFGQISLAKISFLVNNYSLLAQKVDDFPAKDLNGVVEDFTQGRAKSVALNFSGVISDEPILNAPPRVGVKDLQIVLVLEESRLNPYFLVTAQGDLSSGRKAEVEYLLPATD